MKINFLLGSGFSPDCFPRVEKINYNLKNNIANKVEVFDDSTSSWSDKEVLTRYKIENDFLPHNLDLIRSHKSSVLSYSLKKLIEKHETTITDNFNYEVFYDWLNKLVVEEKFNIYEEAYVAALEELTNDFPDYKYKKDHFRKIDINYALKINSIFNFLIYGLLNIKFGDHSKYHEFLKIFHAGNKINIFTLNHDLFLEEMLQDYRLEYWDGFNVKNTKLKGIDKGDLPVFVNAYSNGIKLYKLHGSIDYYKFRINHNDFLFYKIRNYRDLFHSSYEMSGSKFTSFGDVFPQFLTGKSKPNVIKDNYIYSTLFNHFSNSFDSLDYLVVIGYSYSDTHINDVVSQNFNNSSFKVINVNPRDKFPIVNPGRITELSSIDELKI